MARRSDPGPAAPTGTAEVDDVAAALDAEGPRICRWPPCGNPARHLADRDRLDDPPTGRRGQDTGAGRRPEYCSGAHQRRTGDAVRRLKALRVRAAAAAGSDAVPARDRRRAVALLADIGHRLALHGDPAVRPAAVTADSPGATGQGLGAPTGPPSLTVVPNPPPAPPPVAVMAPAAARSPVGSRPHAGTAAVADAHPVLGLRSPEDRPLFDDAWSRLRDANDAVRPVLAKLRRPVDAVVRAKTSADAVADLVELAEAADQILLDVVRLPVPRTGTSSAADRPVLRLAR